MSELRGWRAISDYLAMNQRTAQRHAEHSGLPVRRLNGRDVIADTEKLDGWRESMVREPRWWDNVRMLRAYSLALAALLALAATAAPAYRTLVRLWGRPAAHRWEGSSLVVTDAGGRELWRHGPDRYLRDDCVWVEPHRVLIAPDRTGLYCFDRRGRQQWRYQTDGDMIDFRVLADGRAVVAGMLGSTGAAQLALVDTEGRRVASYPFSSEAGVMSLLELAGGRILVGGFDADRNQAMLAILDDALRERTRVLFPRSRKNRRTGRFNVAYAPAVQRDGAIEVQVTESIHPPRPFLLYVLDGEFRVKHIEPSLSMRHWDLELSEDELEELKRGVEVIRR
jgi:hypothetical protein